jgi:hypothetical protein
MTTGTSEIAVVRNPYYKRHGFCEPYANCLLEAMNALEMTAWRVDYAWTHADGDSGIHAVVMWQEGRQWWLMDSQSDEPRKVRGRTWAARCRCQDKDAKTLEVTQVGTRGWVT